MAMTLVWSKTKSPAAGDDSRGAGKIGPAAAADAGTNCTATSAPVAATAAATSANTGTPATVWPAFLGEVPATTAVPAASMRCV